MALSPLHPWTTKTRWICAKILSSGVAAITLPERVFIGELARLAHIENDQRARELIKNVQAAALEYTLKL